jgi:hypothetical protein
VDKTTFDLLRCVSKSSTVGSSADVEDSESQMKLCSGFSEPIVSSELTAGIFADEPNDVCVCVCVCARAR